MSTVVLGEEKKVENKDVRILIVDDEAMMADSLRQHLTDEGYSVDTAGTGAEAIERFDQGGHHLAICDLQLPDMDGLDIMRHIKDARPTTEVIVVTGYGSVQRAVDATKAGAFYFVEKPFDFEELQPLVEKALERRELVAEAIHYNSLRSKKTFIKVNCAALPKELIESELFGHTKGAFTGAHADKEGLVQHAAGGSLLLDEIAEMPVELQPKLLRVLQERSYRKIGSEKTYSVDFRLICSTNRLPADAIREGLLRDDLFYRISTITIHVPPLRERSEDIQLLTEHFLKMYAKKYDRPITGVSQAAYQRLFAHAWPGNVRELQNVLERAVLLAKGVKIEPFDLPFDNGTLPEGSGAAAWDVPPNMTLEDIEKLVIERTLQRTGGNKQAAANLLGIYRPRLYSKIRKYNIDVTTLTSA